MRPSRCLLILFAFGSTSSISAQNLDQTQPDRGVDFSGVLLLNAYYNDDLVNNRENPWLASPRNPISGDRLEAAGSSVRQSRVTLSAWATDVLGGRAEGELDLDFFSSGAQDQRPTASPRIRRVVARVIWPNAWVLFGQEALPISSLDPSSFSAIGVPGFTGSGNLSRWLPQVRLGLEMGTSLRVGIEAAAVAPRFDNLLDEDSPEPDPAELSKRPFVQGRLLSRWGDDATGGEITVGGHYGWFTDDVGSLGTTRAGAVTARFLVMSRFELRGEAFLGEGLGMLGGGGIDQTLSPDGAPVRTKGGWAQLNVHLAESIEVGGGYGIDDPNNNDLDPATGRGFNVSWELHCHLRASPILVAAEYRRLETTYLDAVYDLQTANHLNMALGFEF